MLTLQIMYLSSLWFLAVDEYKRNIPTIMIFILFTGLITIVFPSLKKLIQSDGKRFPGFGHINVRYFILFFLLFIFIAAGFYINFEEIMPRAEDEDFLIATEILITRGLDYFF